MTIVITQEAKSSLKDHLEAFAVLNSTSRKVTLKNILSNANNFRQKRAARISGERGSMCHISHEGLGIEVVMQLVLLKGSCFFL